MLYDSLKQGIYCCVCKRYKKPCTELFLPDGEEGQVLCLKCNNVVGYTWDKEWQNLFGE